MAPVSATSTQIANIAGPLLVGYLLSWGLYGALSVQVYIYYLTSRTDALFQKLLVYGVFILETLQAILVAHDAFDSFVSGFGNFEILAGVHLTWLTMPVLSGIVAFFVQLFYAHRIITLSKSWVIGGEHLVPFQLAVLQLAGALISGIEGIKAGSILKLTLKIDHIGHGLFDITSGVCDLVIATCMSFYLYRMDKGSLDSTHAIVNRIMRLIIGTGTLTATVAIIDISLYYSGADMHKGWFLTPAVILGRLYSNSMMVVFNSRVDFISGHGRTVSYTGDVVLSNPLGSFRPPETDSIHIDRETWDGHNRFPMPKSDDNR
ncbi:hypothetical protein BDZ94DRAFT_1323929 [Collybia nuda]|uniref:DUF6534 domain-containing protein n=1 Tax=Collybia nuda TaxID=64659 RepID=A0A9P6CCI2_9AGAR|nr:hypothetical protein BDZ94DRAFT_1323929 [Collybia nuda]